MHILCVWSEFCYTARGGFCYPEEYILEVHRFFLVRIFLARLVRNLVIFVDCAHLFIVFQVKLIRCTRASHASTWACSTWWLHIFMWCTCIVFIRDVHALGNYYINFLFLFYKNRNFLSIKFSRKAWCVLILASIHTFFIKNVKNLTFLFLASKNLFYVSKFFYIILILYFVNNASASSCTNMKRISSPAFVSQNTSLHLAPLFQIPKWLNAM